jgi:hypothetical protein
MMSKRVFQSPIKPFALSSGLFLLLTAGPLSAQWHGPTPIGVHLETEIRGSERQAVLFLSADLGKGCNTFKLKTTSTFDKTSAAIEITGYDSTPVAPCPTQGVEIQARAQARVPLPNAWLKPDSEKRIVFVTDSNKSEYLIRRNGFRVELLPEKFTTVVTRQPFVGGRSGISLAVVLWPLNVARLYLLGPGLSGQDFRSALRVFAKAHHFLPADEVHQSLKLDSLIELSVRLPAGALPPKDYNGRRMGVLPGHHEVAVYLGAASYF